jgi:hypothetical protein
VDKSYTIDQTCQNSQVGLINMKKNEAIHIFDTFFEVDLGRRWLS